MSRAGHQPIGNGELGKPPTGGSGASFEPPARQDGPKLAYTIPEVVKATSICRTLIYQDIATGALVARKRGSKTIILPEDLGAYLRALPAVKEVS